MIYIILPVYNRRAVTKEFFESLDKQSHRDFHVILVDDGSTDGTSELLNEFEFSSSLIRGDGQLWWGGALQKGYEYLRTIDAEADVLIINDDCIMPTNLLETGVKLLAENRNSIIQAVAIDKEMQIRDEGAYVDWNEFRFYPASSERSANCFSTRGLIMKLSVFMKIGGFRPKLLPHYLSDYEFTIRAERKGVKLLVFDFFYLDYDSRKTGMKRLPSGFFKKINVLFSKKYIDNPWYYTVFIVISAPPRKKLKCIYKFWSRLILAQLRITGDV